MRMTIPPHATQEELEQLLKTDFRKSTRRIVLAGVLLSPFCYLRCLLNPLWVLGLKVPGIFVTALFGCYVGWQYVQGNPVAGETALLWWAAWAGIMLILHYIFYSIVLIRLHIRNKEYCPAIEDKEEAITAPCALPLQLRKNAEGYLQIELLLHAPVRGLYALRWELCGYEGEFAPHTDSHIAAPAWAEHSIQDTNTLTELYRLEAGNHRLRLRLVNRDAEHPGSATLTQLAP